VSEYEPGWHGTEINPAGVIRETDAVSPYPADLLRRLAVNSTYGRKTAHDLTGTLTYSVTQVALLLGVSRGAIYDMVKRRELRSVRVGRRVLIPKIALAEFLRG